MFRHKRLVLAFLVVFILGEFPVAGQERESAQIRVAAVAHHSGALHVYLNDSVLTQGSFLRLTVEQDREPFAFTGCSVSEYTTIDAGTYTVAYALAEEDEGPDSASPMGDVTLEAGHNYTLAIYGTEPGSGLGMLTFDEADSPAGAMSETESTVVMYHLNRDAPPVSLVVNGEVQFDNLSFGESAVWNRTDEPPDDMKLVASDDPETVVVDYLWFREKCWGIRPADDRVVFAGEYPGQLGADYYIVGFYTGGRTIVDIGEIELGDDVIGELALGERARYALTLQEGANVRLTLTLEAATVGFDPVLRLYDATGNLLAEHDDMQQSDRNSRLTISLEPGAYIVEAGSYMDALAGEYQLNVRGRLLE